MPKGSLLNPQQTKEIAVFLQKGLKTIEIAKKIMPGSSHSEEIFGERCHK